MRWGRTAEGSPPSTDALARAVARGDVIAFALLYDRLAPAVLGAVRAVTPDLAQADRVAEDIVQEVFVELWRTAARGVPDLAGVVAMAHRRAVSRVRAGRRAAPVRVRASPQVAGDPGCRGLAESEWAAVSLAYHRAQTYRDVAATLAVDAGTAVRRMRDGLRLLGGQPLPEPAPPATAAVEHVSRDHPTGNHAR